MKKFEIKKIAQDSLMVSHKENPKFTCRFEDRKFNYRITITGHSDPTGDPAEILLLQKMEKWLSQYHKEKIND